MSSTEWRPQIGFASRRISLYPKLRNCMKWGVVSLVRKPSELCKVAQLDIDSVTPPNYSDRISQKFRMTIAMYI